MRDNWRDLNEAHIIYKDEKGLVRKYKIYQMSNETYAEYKHRINERVRILRDELKIDVRVKEL